jgi:ATP-dependent RNA helicase RhlB
MRFHDFTLHQDILRAVDELGFETCTEVQEKTLAEALSGRDVAVQSQTGTGKTAAFLISIYQLLLSDSRYQGRRALIVAPTRELAVQIDQDAQDLGKHLSFKTATFHGGVGYGGQRQALSDGVDLIIGTPGRILDLVSSGSMSFRDVSMVVIDEADRMFDMGFYPDLKKILHKVPKREDRLMMLFSATLSNRARNIAWEYMREPAEIEIEPEHIAVESVNQRVLHVGKPEKMQVLLGILQREQPESALIFTNTKRSAEEVAKRLEYNGHNARFIIGDIPQQKRLRIIEEIKSGDLPFLVATDVAARGLHIDGLDMVINYDVPEDPENYVHRIGRTGRAGKTGEAVMLACEQYVFGLESIEELIGMKIPVDQLTDDHFAHDKSEGISMRTGKYARESGNRSGKPREGRRSGGRSGRRGGAKSGAKSGSGKSSAAKSGTHHKHGASDKGGKADEASHGGKSDGRAPEGSGGSGKKPSRERSPVEAGGARKDSPKSRSGNKKRSGTEKQSGGRKPAGGGRSKGPEAKGEKPPKQSSSMEERLRYYRDKYGEDFAVSERFQAPGGDETLRSETDTENGSKRNSLFGRVLERLGLGKRR